MIEEANRNVALKQGTGQRTHDGRRKFWINAVQFRAAASEAAHVAAEATGRRGLAAGGGAAFAERAKAAPAKLVRARKTEPEPARFSSFAFARDARELQAAVRLQLAEIDRGEFRLKVLHAPQAAYEGFFKPRFYCQIMAEFGGLGDTPWNRLCIAVNALHGFVDGQGLHSGNFFPGVTAPRLLVYVPADDWPPMADRRQLSGVGGEITDRRRPEFVEEIELVQSNLARFLAADPA